MNLSCSSWRKANIEMQIGEVISEFECCYYTGKLGLN